MGSTFLYKRKEKKKNASDIYLLYKNIFMIMFLFFNCLLPHQILGSSVVLIAVPQNLSGCCVVIVDASKLKHTVKRCG
jgi:hypothetical protein